MNRRALLVVAMRIGDLYLGYTFSTLADFYDNPMNVTCYVRCKSQYLNQLQLQTPTSILLNAERGFVSFGYEAEDNYLSLYVNKKESDVYFFQNFACPLKWYEETNGEIFVKPSNRTDSVPLKTLLCHSVSYFKAQFLKMIQHGKFFKEDEILWVVVYPDESKFDVRFVLLEACQNTGIKKENILLFGENHAIKVFANHIQQTRINNVNDVSTISTIILNCALSQVCPNLAFQMYPHVPTIVIGMSSVITDIESIMKNQLGCSIFTDLTDIRSRSEFMSDLDISLQGTYLRQSHVGHVSIKVPLPLIENLRKHITSSTNDCFQLQSNLLRVKTAIIHQVFHNALKPLVDHLEKEISILNRENIQKVILVGDFSRYIMTKVVLQEIFPQFEFIVPLSSYMAATVGATIAGHEKHSGKYNSGILNIPKMSIVGTLHIEQAALRSSSNYRTSINDKPSVKPSMDTDTTMGNIPNISYLPDPIRPSKIATKLQDLYESDFADILEAIVWKARDHPKSEGILLQILHEAYDECRTQAQAQINTTTRAFHPTIGINDIETALPSDVVKPLTEYRRKNALQYLPRLIKSFVETLPNKINMSNAQLSVCTSFIEKSIECCWLMCVTEPPMFLKFEWNKSEQINLDQLEIEGDDGRYVDCMRWPPLYLHENGPLMNKGVVKAK